MREFGQNGSEAEYSTTNRWFTRRKVLGGVTVVLVAGTGLALGAGPRLTGILPSNNRCEISLPFDDSTNPNDTNSNTSLGRVTSADGHNHYVSVSRSIETPGTPSVSYDGQNFSLADGRSRAFGFDPRANLVITRHDDQIDTSCVSIAVAGK